ncbi:unnamed protein product [Arabidopsis halleri]
MKRCLHFPTLLPYFLRYDVHVIDLNKVAKVRKAYGKCFQNLHYVERHEEHTIAHAIQTSYKKNKLYIWPVPTTTGKKARRVVQTIFAPS